MAEVKIKKEIPKTGAKVIATAAALCMAGCLSITASAAGTEKKDEQDSGKTTVRLGVTRTIPKPVSFEVPLYYTAAIVKADPATNQGRKNQIIYPEGYYIKNIYDDIEVEGTKIEGSGKELVVARIQVASVNGATWDLVSNLNGTEDASTKNMAVRLGGLSLPAVKAGNTTFSDIDLKAQKSVFYDPTAQEKDRYQVIGDHNGDGIHDGDGQTKIDLELQIPAEYEPTKNGPTIAQFRVAYTLTTKNADGTLVGYWDQPWVDRDYIGPEKETAESSAP